jgi:hypothetical protein
VIQGSSSASSFFFTIHFWFKTWWPGACFLHLLFSLTNPVVVRTLET